MSEMKMEHTLYGQIVLYYEKAVLSSENIFCEKEEGVELKSSKSDLMDYFEYILKNPKICVDESTVDHLIIFLVLAQGKSTIHVGELSSHSLTALDIVKMFFPTFFISVQKCLGYTKLEIENKFNIKYEILN